MTYTEKDHVRIKAGAVVDPSAKISGTADSPAIIGEYTVVEAGAEIKGASIGAYATVKAGASAGEGVYVGDFAILEENTRLPGGAKVPSRAVAEGDPFSIVRGLTKEELDAAKGRASEGL